MKKKKILQVLTFTDDWLTNETMSLEIPLIKKISEQLQLVLRKNESKFSFLI